MHSSFKFLFPISVVGAFLAAFSHAYVWSWIGFFIGIASLVKYHLNLKNEKNLTPDQIDSVYFFGFLMTVITLLLASFAVGMNAKEIDLTSVLVQFGLGMTATAYGLFARLHLTDVAGPQTEDQIIMANQQLAHSVRDAAAQFDLAAIHVTDFVQRASARIQELETQLHRTSQRYEQDLQNARNAFNSQLANASRVFAQELTENRTTLLREVTETIQSSIQAFGVTVHELMGEFQRLRTEVESVSFQAFADQLMEVQSNISSVLNSLSASTLEASQTAGESITELSAAMRKALLVAGRINENLQSLSRVHEITVGVNGVVNSLHDFRSESEQLRQSLSGLIPAIDSFEQQLNQAVTNGTASVQTLRQISDLVRALDQSAPVIERLLASFQQFTQANLGDGINQGHRT